MSLRTEQVFFVVGNHEMWTGRRRSTAKGDGDGELEVVSSVDKLVQLHRMCEVGGGGTGGEKTPVLYLYCVRVSR